MSLKIRYLKSDFSLCSDNFLTISCSGARNSPRPLNSVLGFQRWYVTFAIITDIYA